MCILLTSKWLYIFFKMYHTIISFIHTRIYVYLIYVNCTIYIVQIVRLYKWWFGWIYFFEKTLLQQHSWNNLLTFGSFSLRTFSFKFHKETILPPSPIPPPQQQLFVRSLLFIKTTADNIFILSKKTCTLLLLD